MIIKIFPFTVLILLALGCQDTKNDFHKQTKPNTVSSPDAAIGRRSITDEIAGAAYRKRATGYFVIVDKDTSDFMPILAS